MRILRRTTSMLVTLGVVGLVTVVAATPASAAGLGSLDASWGTSGKVVLSINPGGDDEATAAVGQPDGRLVVAGKAYDGSTYPHMALARLTASGALDTTFGLGGTVVVPYFGVPGGSGTNGDVATSVARQSDGKILVAGAASDAAGDGAFAVARYNADGTADPSFGTAGTGRVTLQIGANGLDDAVNGIALQADGSIVLAGSWTGGWAVARLTSAGQLDTTFNSGGAQPGVQAFSLGDPLADNAYAVAVQRISAFKFNIVIAGAGAHGAGSPGAFNEDFALVRLTSAGVIDTSFGGGDGKVFYNAGSKADAITSMAIQPDASIVVAGPGASAAVTVARFGPNGALDTSFGTSGKTALGVTAEEASPQTGLAVAGDGSILVGGTARSGADDVLVARLTSAGALDTAFGSSGITTTNVGTYGSVDRTAALALDSVGRVDVVGSASASGATQWFATRYTTADPPTVVTKPVAATSCGTPVTFSVAASAPGPIQYGWQVQGPLGGAWITVFDTPYISGSSTGTVTILPGAMSPSDNGDHLRAVVNSAGGTVYTPSALLHVGTAPVVTTNPADTSPNSDGVASFTAAASGSPAPTVQWYVKPAGGSFTAISDATSSPYTFRSDGNEFGNQYRARFTNFCGSVTTTSGTLYVSS